MIEVCSDGRYYEQFLPDGLTEDEIVEMPMPHLRHSCQWSMDQSQNHNQGPPEQSLNSNYGNHHPLWAPEPTGFRQKLKIPAEEERRRNSIYSSLDGYYPCDSEMTYSYSTHQALSGSRGLYPLPLRRASIKSVRSSYDNNHRRLSCSTCHSLDTEIFGVKNCGLVCARTTKANLAYYEHELQPILTYKTENCGQPENHAWKRCHYAHGEKRRRNPYVYLYAFSYCHKFDRNTREWSCTKGNSCKYGHSKEEELYHPLRFKTIKCKSYDRVRCENYNCAFYHEDPSPIVNNDGLKSLLLMLTDLAKCETNRNKRRLELSDEEWKEFVKIVTGNSERAVESELEEPMDELVYEDHPYWYPMDDKDKPRAYITLWLYGYYERWLKNWQSTQSGNEGNSIPCFEDYMFTKAELIFNSINDDDEVVVGEGIYSPSRQEDEE